MGDTRALFAPTRRGKITIAVTVCALFGSLYATSYVNYLLFHGLAEMFSIVVAGGVFLFAWNTRTIDESDELTNLGIAYLFIAFLDTMHTFSYAGMGVFTDYDYYANQAWVVARAIEAFALLMYAVNIGRRRLIAPSLVMLGYGAVTFVGVYLIYIARVFPACFVEGQGQTTFKIIAELSIIATLVVTGGLLVRSRSDIDEKIYRLMLWSIGLTILAETAFTIYISNYGISNMIGHFAKLGSFYLIYKAIIETGLRSPLSLLFNRLKTREQQLQNANDAKDRLFSIIAHDLKGPIGAVASFTEIPYEEFVSLKQDEQRLALTEMHSAAARSLALLEDLMMWARNQTGQTEIHPVSFTAETAVNDAVNAVLSSARQKNIGLSTGGDTEDFALWADQSMVTTVLRNLLSNAIKFTARGGTVSVQASRAADTMVVIAVSDTGVGMSEHVRNNLFQIGKQTSMLGTENEQGTGFGLILSKELIEKNGGDIHVESEPGSGTTIRVLVPGKPKSGNRQPESAPPQSHRSHR